MSGSKGYSGGVFRIDDEQSLSANGIPNSRTDLYKQGKRHQSRWYDSKGNAIRNRDYIHGGKMNFPHDHQWTNGTRGKDHLPPDWNWK
jgi:hypothetical protein